MISKRQVLLFLLVTISLLCFRTAPLAAKTYNDDFEQAAIDTQSWTMVTGNGTMSLSRAQSHSGLQSVKLFATGSLPDVHLTQTFYTPLQRTASIWFYDPAPSRQMVSGHFTLKLSGNVVADVYADGNDPSFYYATGAGNGGRTAVARTADWHHFEVDPLLGKIRIDNLNVGSFPANANYDSVDLGVTGPGTQLNDGYYFDDFTIAPVSSSSFTPLADNFEKTTIDPNWTVIADNGTVTTSTSQQHGGARSVQMSATSGGQRELHLMRDLPSPIMGTTSVWFYDAAPGQQTLYARFLLLLGANSVAFIYIQDYDGNVYYAGSGEVGGPTTVARTLGWHHFVIDTEMGKIYIDNVQVLTLPPQLTFDSIDLDVSGPGGRPNTTYYFDDFQLIPTALPPTINNFSPASGRTGAQLTITGTNFISTTAVALHGAAIPFKVISNTLINATVPISATTGRLQVTNPGGTATSTTDFTVLPNTTSVPNVVGLAQAQAEATILAAGLTVGARSYQSSTTIPPGAIISQDPGTNSVVNLGAAVNLVISTGLLDNNDSCATATAVAPGAPLIANLYDAHDVDFYRVQVDQPNTTLFVTLKQPNAANFSIDLYDSCTNPIGQARHVGQLQRNGETLAWFNVTNTPGLYWLAVKSATTVADTAPYTLNVELNPDREEPNDTCTTSVALTPGVPHSAYVSHPGDADFYQFPVDQPNTLVTVKVEPLGANYEVTLYNNACIEAIGQARHVGGENIWSYNVGTNTGAQFIAVRALNDQYSTMPYTVTVQLAAPQSLIVTNRARLMRQVDPTTSEADLYQDLNALAVYPSVAGVLLDVDSDPTVQAAYTAWDSTPLLPSAANQVARAIKTLLQAKLAQYPSLHYIVLVGNDDVIPFSRMLITPPIGTSDLAWYPESVYLENQFAGGVWDLNQPSLVALQDNFTLSDDFYGSDTGSVLQSAPDQPLYIPRRPLGRLVETRTEIRAAIAAFLNGHGALKASNALAAGADFNEIRFLTDATTTICGSFTQQGINVNCRTDDQWNADWLRGEFAKRPDITNINTHANHFSFQTPQGDQVTSTDITAKTLLFTLGCQAGLNIAPGNPQAYDFPQAVVGHGGALIANTGWGYAQVGELGFSEALLADFSSALLTDTVTTIGDALVLAKQKYYVDEAPLDYYDMQVLNEMTLYGLPMLRVDHSRVTTASPVKAANVLITQSAATQSDEPSREQRLYWFTPSDYQRQQAAWGDYYTYHSAAHGEPGLPLQPRLVASIATNGDPVHGVAFISGAYTTTSGFNPVISAPFVINATPPTTEPKLNSGRWEPTAFWRLQQLPDFFGESGIPQLVVDLGQFQKQTGNTGNERLYQQLSLTLYRSPSADWVAPNIDQVEPITTSTGLQLTVRASDASGLYTVFVTYTTSDGAWHKLDLTSTDNLAWQGVLPTNSELTYVVQAVDRAGNVAVVHDGPCTLCNGAQHLFLPLIAVK